MTEREVPASTGQRLLWFMDRYRNDNGTLNAPMACRLRGPFDPAAFASAFAEVTRRHEALRTTFTGRGRRLTQVVHEPRAVPVPVHDVSAAADPEAELQRRLAAELRAPVDVAEWPLRLSVWRLAADHHVLALNLHHLVTDAWSYDVLWADLCRVYNREVADATELEPVGWQYADFARWQEAELGPSTARFRELEAFWRSRLDGARLPPLPPDPGGPRVGAIERAYVGPDVVDGLRLVGRRARATFPAVTLAAFYAVLYRASGRTDLAVASLFANRTRPEVRTTVGFCANMLLLRARLPEAPTFADALRASRTATLDAFLHQDLPCQLFRLDGLDTGGGRVDDVVFHVLANHPAEATQARPAGCEVDWLPPDPLASRFDVELRLAPHGRGYEALLYYNAARIDRAWARDLIDGYAATCVAATGDPDAPLR